MAGTNRLRSPRGRRGRHVKKEGQRKRGTTRRSPRRSVHSEGRSYKPPSGEIGMCLRVGRMGPQVRMERDSRTRFGARAPGVERPRPLERRCFSAQRPSAQNGDPTRAAGSTKGGGKPSDVQAASNGQTLSETPALKRSSPPSKYFPCARPCRYIWCWS